MQGHAFRRWAYRLMSALSVAHCTRRGSATQGRRALLRLVGVLLTLQMGWAQLEHSDIDEPPSLDLDQMMMAPHVPGELIVGLEDSNLALPVVAMEMVGTIVSRSSDAFLVRLDPGMTLRSVGEFLRALPGVRYVQPNYIYSACADPNDRFYGLQYALRLIQANRAWDIWQPVRTVYIAVLDTGILLNHPDLTNKLRRHSNGAVYGYNVTSGNPNQFWDDDPNLHGTQCAGVAAAEINNGIAIAGVAAWNPYIASSHTFVQLMPVKVLDSQGIGNDFQIGRAIEWAVNNGAHILSMSFSSDGPYGFSEHLQTKVNEAWNRGCLLVAGAGNGGSSAMKYPAAYTNCIAVAATDSSDTLASFSQYGSWVDIAAPGVGIATLSQFANVPPLSDGTSVACPHVAGAAAMIWSQNPTLTNAQVREALETNVDPYRPYQGRTIAPGAGRLNVYRAVRATTLNFLASVYLDASSIIGGQSLTGRVSLLRPAPAGGYVVHLSSSHPGIATVSPSVVVVPPGARQATFTVQTSPVSRLLTVEIIASSSEVYTARAQLWVGPPWLTSLVLNPTSVTGGYDVVGTVRLSGPAPQGGCVVNLSSSDTTVASVPSSVMVPAGRESMTFLVATRPVSNTTTVTITASAGGVSRQATLTVNAPTLDRLSITPTEVFPGQTATGTVTLTGPAPAGGAVVQLSCGHQRVSVPSSVMIPAGSRSASFTIRTSFFGPSVSVLITATYGGVSRSAALTVR